jgi:hypothetical protein
MMALRMSAELAATGYTQHCARAAGQAAKSPAGHADQPGWWWSGLTLW